MDAEKAGEGAERELRWEQLHCQGEGSMTGRGKRAGAFVTDTSGRRQKENVV